MDAGDDFLSDITAFVVADKTVNSEFGNNRRLVHINAVFWNAVFDSQNFVKLVGEADGVRFFKFTYEHFA